MIRTKHHHVCDTEMLVVSPFDDVMILNQRKTAFAAAESGLLP